VKASDFFDSQLEDDLLPLPLYFRLLRRFERTRDRVAAGLLPGGDSLLDIGCGTGELIELVADRYRRVVGADISPKAVATAAQQRRAPRATWMVLDASRPLPFASGSFSSLVSLSTLQYVLDPEAFLREAHRLLAPGGHLLVETPNVAYLPHRLRLLAGQPIRTSYWRHGLDGGNLHYFTVDSLRDLIERSGFRAHAVSGSGVFAPLRTWRVSLLCGNVFVLATRQ
jgi:SAM-dependent methyltransferase